MISDGRAVLTDRPALRRCIAVDVGSFASDYWDSQPLLSRSADLPRDFSDLLTLGDVDELLSRRGLRTPFVRLAREGSIIDSARWTGSGGIGAKVRDQVLDERVLSSIVDGATVVLQGLHRLWPPLIDFASRLVFDLGHPVQINAYITPPQSQGFSDHYDTHDVFVLALAGRKRWHIRPPVISRPDPDDPWTDHADAVRDAAAAPPLIDTVLEAGDALYLPRGYLHSATAEGGTCAHLTVGIHPITRRAVAHTLLDALAGDPDLASSLPIGIVDDPAALRDELAAVAALLAERAPSALTTAAEAPGSARRVARQLTTDARPEPLAPIAQASAASAVAVGDAIRLRRGVRIVVQTRPDGTTQLDAGVARIPIDASEASAIAALSDGQVYDADGLPDLPSEASISLVARLLSAGIVVPATR